MWEMLLRKLPRNSPILPLHPVNSVCYRLNPSNQILQLHLHKKHWGKDWTIPLRNNKGGIQSRRTRRPPGWPLKFFPRSFWSFQIGIINFFFFSASIITGKRFVLWPQRQGALGELGNLLFSVRGFQRNFECIMNCEHGEGFLPLSHPFSEFPTQCG